MFSGKIKSTFTKYYWYSLTNSIHLRLNTYVDSFVGKILDQVQRTFGTRASLVPAAGDKFSLERNWRGRRTR